MVTAWLPGGTKYFNGRLEQICLEFSGLHGRTSLGQCSPHFFFSFWKRRPGCSPTDCWRWVINARKFPNIGIQICKEHSTYLLRLVKNRFQIFDFTQLEPIDFKQVLPKSTIKAWFVRLTII